MCLITCAVGRRRQQHEDTWWETCRDESNTMIVPCCMHAVLVKKIRDKRWNACYGALKSQESLTCFCSWGKWGWAHLSCCFPKCPWRHPCQGQQSLIWEQIGWAKGAAPPTNPWLSALTRPCGRDPENQCRADRLWRLLMVWSSGSSSKPLLPAASNHQTILNYDLLVSLIIRTLEKYNPSTKKKSCCY